MRRLCGTCTHASSDMLYCGEGMTMGLEECSGYVRGEQAGGSKFTMYHGCNFPVTNRWKVGRGYSYLYRIRMPCDTFRYYLTGILNDLRYMLATSKVVGCLVLTYHSGPNGVLLDFDIRTGPEGVPVYLWWLDPTLSHDEVIPMYGLLLAILRLEWTGTEEQARSTVEELLTIGLECKGKSLDDWSTAITAGPQEPAKDRVWGTELHLAWVSAMDDLWLKVQQ